ncbi:hypothetical protein ACIQNU_21750 [Streptomyces sp. NPDC091292]|uniref:hypothetical protein n=1 Tax=Streptomyces sp. NPDC091292 TaxID=3365991 RepID=UPI00380F4F12
MRDKTQANSAAPGDGLIRIGALVFLLGAVATLTTVAPLFLGTKPFPTYMFGLSMLMGVGFALAGAGLLRGIVAQRREVAKSRSEEEASAVA